MQSEDIGLMCGAANNTSPAAGMIGYFARLASEKDLVYLGFHNSMSYLVPHGSKKAVWGTNPVTIGAPGVDSPVIWDCSSSKISVGEVVLAKREGGQIDEGIAVDKEGNDTTDPVKALSGGIYPFAEHKGSGMAMMVELLAGAMIGSSITPNSQWNWGSFFILINPTQFQSIDQFKSNVLESIKSLKKSPKAKEVKEVYYPGEKSQEIRNQHIKEGSFELSDSIYNELTDILDTK